MLEVKVASSGDLHDILKTCSKFDSFQVLDVVSEEIIDVGHKLLVERVRGRERSRFVTIWDDAVESSRHELERTIDKVSETRARGLGRFAR